MRVALLLMLTLAACGSASQPRGTAGDMSTGTPTVGHPSMAPYPVLLDAVEKACAMNLSCLSPPPIASGGNCVTTIELALATGTQVGIGHTTEDTARFVDCAAKSSDCAGALDCASRHHGQDWCAAHPSDSCDGDELVRCVSGWGVSVLDCSVSGQHCVVTSAGALCTNGNSCDPATEHLHCDGNREVLCSGFHYETAFDCSTVIDNGMCRAGDAGGYCIGAGSEHCPTTATTSACDGTALTTCYFGIFSRVDCGQFHSHCATDSGGNSTCVPDAPACAADASDRCAGNALEMCVNGQWQTIDCSSIGKSTCQADSTGARCA
jgi:hypothetical protein